ncbi:DUF2735 domain-containing protein [Methylobacterium sp.]|jgi:hypothetical protein|uniref:DUF2735 domain-containing protein n=1 Tax=Methylobacterium sp. TaxID=409 RepID=UPI0025E3594D|nr:DUF2735 domain-containing protein [Methylobacterium sp.]MBY0259494.1 DUF2735 domain-containing protein [Methylobacterium sp.]
MTMGHHQHTATILPFPGRAGSAGKGTTRSAGTITSLTAGSSGRDKPRQPAQPCFMDSWYHQAAIDEAATAIKP